MKYDPTGFVEYKMVDTQIFFKEKLTLNVSESKIKYSKDLDQEVDVGKS